MTGLKYNIAHVDIEAGSFDSASLSPGAHYVVFWFGNIPLGEHYFQHFDPRTNNFWDVCLNSIWPVLVYYRDIFHPHVHIQKVGNPTQSSIQLVCSQTLPRRNECPSEAKLSVVICTKDRPDDLRVCLRHLQMQICRPREIIVVDNAPRTESTRQVCEHFNVKYIREDRVGLDIARNTGARAAEGEIVAYTDDDTMPHPMWVGEMMQAFSDASIDAMTGLVLAASLQTEAEIIFEKFWPFNRGYLPKTYDSKFFQDHLNDGPPVWEVGAGANMAFRKQTFDEVGFFDERLDAGAAGCNGDSEMWYRILAAGKKIRYHPSAVVQHKHRSSMVGLKSQLHAYMRGFTVAMLIQYSKFKHKGNLKHLFKVLPTYYLSLIRKGFPHYNFQYKTLMSEITGVASGLVYYLKNRREKTW